MFYSFLWLLSILPLALWLPAPAPGPWLPALNLSPAPGSLLSTTRLTSENARERSCEKTKLRENEAARERENAGLFPLQSDLIATNYCRISPAHRGASSTPRCFFIPSSASCRSGSSVPVYSRSTAPTLLKPFSKHSSKAGKTKKEGVCARREAVAGICPGRRGDILFY